MLTSLRFQKEEAVLASTHKLVDRRASSWRRRFVVRVLQPHDVARDQIPRTADKIRNAAVGKTPFFVLFSNSQLIIWRA